MTNYLALALGWFVLLEALANLIYWRGSRQPNNRIWQVGRAGRAAVGLIMIGMGVIF